jgi:hypothetical protein
MVLDLTDLTEDQYKSYYNFSIEIQQDFNLLIEDVFKSNSSQNYMSNLILMFSNTLSRNNYQSNLFSDILSLYFVDQMLKNNQFSTIIVENLSLKRQLVNNYPNKLIILSRKKLGLSYYVKNAFLIPFLDFAHILFRASNYYYFKSQKRIKKLLSTKQCILIDTFIHQDSIGSEKYIERNYNNILSSQNLVDEKKIFFVPTINGSFNNKILNNIVTNSKENIIYKHDFLTLNSYYDIIKLMIHFKIKTDKLFFRGLNVTSLVKENTHNKKFDLSVFEALISFFFFKHIKKLNVDLKGVIDWNENQPIDKGFIKGCKTFYRNIHIKGYQGFIVSYFYNMHLCPTDLEIKNGLIPDELIVTGSELIAPIKRFSNKINVTIGPAFRFLKFKNSSNFNKLSKKILVILPFGINESINLIKTLDELCENNGFNHKDFYIKPHPTDNFKLLKSRIANANKYSFTFGSFSNIISQFSITMGNTSSALMESLMNSVPVIVIPNHNGITQNPIPLKLDNKLWKLCFSIDDIIASIYYFTKNTDLLEERFIMFSKDVNSKYFLNVDKETVNDFLNF